MNKDNFSAAASAAVFLKESYAPPAPPLPRNRISDEAISNIAAAFSEYGGYIFFTKDGRKFSEFTRYDKITTSCYLYKSSPSEAYAFWEEITPSQADIKALEFLSQFKNESGKKCQMINIGSLRFEWTDGVAFQGNKFIRNDLYISTLHTSLKFITDHLTSKEEPHTKPTRVQSVWNEFESIGK